MPASMSSARFVGRDAAFARLAPSLEEAAAGDATTVLVHGAGGIGVTRFIVEAARRLEALDEPFLVLRGRSYRAGIDDPYGPILRALGPAFQSANDERERERNATDRRTQPGRADAELAQVRVRLRHSIGNEVG